MSRLDIVALAIAANAQGGGEASGELDINANGTYNVARYATANVNVPPVLAKGVPIDVSELPTPTAEDVGKVYLNTTNGEYYVGEEQAQEFVVGESLGDKIYFDTTKNPMVYMKPNINDILLGGVITNPNGEFVVQMLDLMSQSGGSNETMYGYAIVAIAALKADFVWVEGKGGSIEEFNQAFGTSITKFGWQMDELDTSEFADYTVMVNNLASYDNLAYKSKTITFKPLDEPPILQEKTVTENGVVTADAGYDGLSKVTVEVADKGTATLNALIDGSITEIESGAESVRVRAFENCTFLKTADFPNATSVGAYAFTECRALTTANFPVATSIGSGAFNNCTELTSVYFPNATSISQNAFTYCYSLVKIIVGTNQTTIATLGSTNVFTNCYHILGTTSSTYNPTGAKDGYIYVPLALVADYRVATYWSSTYYATQIMPYVATVEELANIDGTTYDKACVGTDYIEYTYNGTSWEVYER